MSLAANLYRQVPLRLLAQSTAGRVEGEQCRKQQVTRVRYADPISWAAVAAVAKVIIVPQASENNTGVLTCSLTGPVATMQHVTQSAAAGNVSPLRFPAANPGALAGVSAIVFGLRGPTLNFTMAPITALPFIRMMAHSWLHQRQAERVIVLGESPDSQGESQVRCLLLAAEENQAEEEGRTAENGVTGPLNSLQANRAAWMWWAGHETEEARLEPLL